MSDPIKIAQAPWKRERTDTWNSFQSTIEPYLDGNWLFRGVSSVRHSLVPGIGRPRAGIEYSLQSEKSIFEQFKREALPLLRARPVDDWEWLALAQHHGVLTRLLDWSESPYVALFFAVWGNDDEDAGLFVMRRPAEALLAKDPFEVNEISFFYPGHISPRLVSQRGVFTIHPRPTEKYLGDDMVQIVVNHEAKTDFRRKLDVIGTHHAAIFSDLDNLCRRLVALQAYQSMKPPIVLKSSSQRTVKHNPRDPQKGKWGLKPSRNGWILSAEVFELQEDWYRIRVEVAPSPRSRKELIGGVELYLHDSFDEPVILAVKQGRKAVREIAAYGAFTIGALIKQDGTTLELDLADLADAPQKFRER